jgi:hypothetical protein
MTVLEKRDEDLKVRAEPLGLAERICKRMVDVERVEDGALLLDADPAWAAAVSTVLVGKGLTVTELRCVGLARGDSTYDARRSWLTAG